MKKIFLIIIALVLLFTAVSCKSEVETTPFRVGDSYYNSLQEACNAAIANLSTDSEIIVEILEDVSGPGVSINTGADPTTPKPLLIDLGDNTYTVTVSKASAGIDFDLSGVLFVLSGDEGKLKGSSATLFSAENSQLIIGGSLDIEIPDGAYFAVAGKDCGIGIDTYFEGSINGNIKLNNASLVINSEEGIINIGKLELSGPNSKLDFAATRTTENTKIGGITIDASQTKPAIAITSSHIFTESTDYDKLDEIIATSGLKIHRHEFKNTADNTHTEASCISEEYGSFKCTNANCSVVDIKKTGEINPSKHKLVHVNAVTPTSTDYGIEDCYQCEDCHEYFTTDSEHIDPILLATDNILYSDMELGGIDDLNNTIQTLEANLENGGTSKGSIDTASSILTIISSIFTAAEKMEDTSAADMKKILSDLEKINSDIGQIKDKINNLTDKLQKISDGLYYNNRIKELNGFFAKTNPYFSANIKVLNSDASESEKNNKISSNVSEWATNNSGVLSEPTKLLMNSLLLNNDQKKNLFQVYDYIGRTSMGWEKFSLKLRVAMRAYDMLTMLEGYKMLDWYYKYYYTGDNNVKEAILKDLKDAWTKYVNLCNSNKMTTDSPNQASCWLLNYTNTYNLNPVLVDFEGAIRRNKSKYRFYYQRSDVSIKTINQLISDANGVSLPYSFFETMYTWYNKNRSVKKNIYEVLEILGFNAVDGVKMSDLYDNRRFILAEDPNKNRFIEVCGTKWYVEKAYKSINFGTYWPADKRNNDWVGVGSALAKNKPFETQKIFTGSNFKVNFTFRGGKITKLGNPTGNKFYKLTTGNYTPVVYQ